MATGLDAGVVNLAKRPAMENFAPGALEEGACFWAEGLEAVEGSGVPGAAGWAGEVAGKGD